jgi:hypothetical protein
MTGICPLCSKFPFSSTGAKGCRMPKDLRDDPAAYKGMLLCFGFSRRFSRLPVEEMTCSCGQKVTHLRGAPPARCLRCSIDAAFGEKTRCIDQTSDQLKNGVFFSSNRCERRMYPP